MNEFEIIGRYFTRQSADADVLIGVGDDAAVLAAFGRIAVTVDTLLEGVHFPPGAPAVAVGHRALAVSLSDIAAMGARPRWTTLALTLPHADPAWLEAFSAGFFALADRFGVALVGGNLTHGPLSITVDVIGSFAADAAPLTRAGGKPGEDLYVTGTLGDAAGALAIGSAPGSEAARFLTERYLMPTPRVEAGLALTGIASAAIDVSDGLAADLGHLCEASGTGAIVDIESLPRSAALAAAFSEDDTLRLALTGGDDYELCFAAAPEAAERVAAALAPSGTPAHWIGRLTEGRDVVFRRRGERVDPPAGGYLHFR